MIAIYARLSNPKKGDKTDLSLEDQEKQCRERFPEWQLSGDVKVYRDVDSAFDEDTRRPGFEQMLEDIASTTGRTEVCVVETERLVRQVADGERLIRLLKQDKMKVHAISGRFDTETPEQVFEARFRTLMNQAESERIQRRVLRGMQRIAEQGRSHGGPRMYGLTAQRDALVPEEAELIREAKDRVLEGEAVLTIARDWERRGVRTPLGKVWTANSLSRILRNPSIAGRRVHQGEVVGKAAWPPIITEDEHRALMVKLDPARTARGNNRPRSYVLGRGLVRCGLCGGQLRAKWHDKTRKYACHKEPGRPGCGRITIKAEWLEEYIRELAFAFVLSPEFDELVAQRHAEDDSETRLLMDALATDRQRLEAVEHAHFIDGTVQKGSYVKLARELMERIERHERALERVVGARSVAVVPSGEEALREAWATRDIAWRAAFLGAVIDRVVISPGVSGRRAFDPSRVEVVWHD